MTGTKVYIYDADNFTFVNLFRSLRATSNAMPISCGTLTSKLNTGKLFKGYNYYTNPLKGIPNCNYNN